ncbi:undecaprenyl pyrophosphate synthase [Thiomonas sp. X19]|nr:undecaprenyl pyrophosphate synthase [Thiomonas sp. X19]
MASKQVPQQVEQAPPGLRHIAVVMDGNGRWAQRRLLPRTAGHKYGVDALKSVVRGCIAQGVPFLTVFAFSSENWNRPADEVSALMDLFVQALRRETRELAAQGVRLRFVGERSAFDTPMRELMQQAEDLSAGNTRLVLNVAINYGGRWDLVQAMQALQASGEPISEESLAQHLCLADVPAPDLLIRTGGERRISNFLLWQIAYTEFYFTDILWPDFDEKSLALAIADYAQRERRFGTVHAQAPGLRVA